MLAVVKLVGHLHGCHEQFPHILDTVSLFLMDLYHLTLEQVVDPTHGPWAASSFSSSSSGLHLLEFLLFNDRFGKHYRDSEVHDAMGVALAHNNLQAVQLLLRYAPNAPQNESISDWPLDRAVQHGHLELVQWFWNHQSDCPQLMDQELQQNRKLLRIKSAILVAAVHGQLEIIQYFCQTHAADVDRDILRYAAGLAVAQGHERVVKFLVLERLVENADWLRGLALNYVEIELVLWLESLPHQDYELTPQNRRWLMDAPALLDDKEIGSWFCVVETVLNQPADASIIPPEEKHECLGTRVVAKANVSTLQWVCERLPLFKVDDGFFVKACKAGHMGMVEWIWNKLTVESALIDRQQVLAKAMESACANGHVDVAQYLLSLGFDLTSSMRSSLAQAVADGHMPMVQWLRTNHGDDVLPSSIELSAMIDTAAINGHTDVVAYLDDLHNTSKYLRKALYNSAKKGNMKMLQFLLAKGFNQNLMECRKALEHAIRYGQLQVVQLLYERIRQIESSLPSTEKSKKSRKPYLSLDQLMKPLTESAFGGFFDVVEFIVSRETMTMAKGRRKAKLNAARLIREAAEAGSLRVIQLLHQANSFDVRGFSYDTMDLAAEAGHLNIVRFLHEQRNEGCSEEAMDGAAKNGFLQVVEYLHESIPDVECSTEAMNSAAYYGHLQIVKFLDENREEGCTADAMQNAAWNGHFEVVKFLYSRGYKSSRKVLQNAASSGHLEMVEFLITNGYGAQASVALSAACEDGRVGMVKWLVENDHVSQEDISDALQVAQEEAQEAEADVDGEESAQELAALRRVVSFLKSWLNPKSCKRPRLE